MQVGSVKEHWHAETYTTMTHPQGNSHGQEFHRWTSYDVRWPSLPLPYHTLQVAEVVSYSISIVALKVVTELLCQSASTANGTAI